MDASESDRVSGRDEQPTHDASDALEALAQASHTAGGLLREIDARLARGPDAASTLRAVVETLVPALADACTLELTDEAHGELRLAAAAHARPAALAELEALARELPPPAGDGHGPYAALRSGAAEIYSPADADPCAPAPDTRLGRAHQRLGLSTWAWLPLRAFGLDLGVLGLAWAEASRAWVGARLPLASEVSTRLAVTAAHARLAESLEQERRERARDIRQRQQAEAEVRRLNRDLRHRLDELQTLFEVAPVGIAVAHDPQGRTITMNPAGARLRGIEPECNASLTGAEAAALPFRAMRDGRPVPPEQLPMQYALSRRVVVQGMELDLVCSDGTVHTLYEYASPLYDEHGQVRGGLGVFVDITSLKQVEAALRESRERLLAALLASGTGTFRLEVGSGRLHMDDNLHALLGLAPGAGVHALSALLERVHPEERAELECSIRDCAASARDLDAHFRVVWPDGTQRWLAAKAKTVCDTEDRVALYMTGAILDVTERKQAVDALRTSEERFRMALIGSPIVVFAHDAQLRYTWLHNASVHALGDPIGRRDDELLRPPHGLRLLKFKQRVLESGKGERREMGMKLDGVLRFFDVTVEPRRDEKGRIIGLIGAAVDITHRKKLEAQLRRQARLLRQADHRKDEFLAMLAHELRNPLAPIRNAVRLLKRHEARLDPDVRWAGEIIERQAQQMTRLVDDLLDVARITQGRITLKRTPVELAEVINRAIETVEPQLQLYRHRLILSVPEEPVWLHADQPRLSQAVANLLHNAAKYTEPGGEIRVAARCVAEQVEVGVRDTGMGIAPELLARIFDLFSQADRSLDRSQGGLGLGLTLVRTLVEMHGGTVQAFSEGEGLGSEFVIRLPRLMDAGARPAPAPAPAARPVAARRVLVVDDNRDAAVSFAFLLESLGHEVQSVYSGTDALVAWARHRHEVIFLDIGLPGLDGYDTARRLRAKAGDRAFVLVALTGYGDEQTQRRCREAGFDHYLLKPGDLDTVVRLLESAPVSAGP